jgi:uncharacterized protein YndB with AHSA1/START domain
MPEASSAARTTDREILLTRVFDAPRELVFNAWIDPEHIAQWFGPSGFTTTIHEMDVRPGGVWRFIMHGPDGVDYPNKIVYLEIVKPQRLVYDHFSDDVDESGQFHVSMTFAELDGKTLLSMQMLFESSAERDRVVNEYGAIEGGEQTLDRLAAYLANVRRRA